MNNFPHEPDIQSHARASDNVQNPDKVRSLLKDLREARQAKSREGLAKLDHSELSVRTTLSIQGLPSLTTIPVAKLMFHGDQRDTPVFHTSYERLYSVVRGRARYKHR